MSPKITDFRMSRLEFVALIAMMFATIAFSVDAMLPALPEIANDLATDNAHRTPLILTAFVFGMGIGTIIAGPLSDAFGRRMIISIGSILYILSAAVAWASTSLEVMLVARIFQGLGAAAPRIVSVAIVRDLYAGRDMAKIVSLIMMIFTLVPAIAPLLGMVIINFYDWRAIFLAFIGFSLISLFWMGLRLPETLAQVDRRPLRFRLLLEAVSELADHRTVRLSILVQTVAMAMLFSMLLLVQPIYYDVYDRAESFPYWFGAVAVIAGSASLLNAFLVGRLGMRRMVTTTFGAQFIVAVIYLVGGLADLPEPYGFAAFVVWQTCIFFQAGLTLGNLNAIAMEPMGHIAGMAASVIGSVSTILASMIASFVALLFSGAVSHFIAVMELMAAVGFLLMIYMGYVERRNPRVSSAPY